MTPKQLADRIGNVDEDLVRHPEEGSGGGRGGRQGGRVLGRVLALAAALALAASTFVIGALAFSRETIVEVEVPVEPEHQIVEVESLGLTLIFPDSWKDRYIAEVYDSVDEEGNRRVEIGVYCKAVCESYEFMGCLFDITYAEGFFWTAQDFSEYALQPGKYLFSTKDGTCILSYPSDVQYPSRNENEALFEEYLRMGQEARSEVSIQLNRILS